MKNFILIISFVLVAPHAQAMNKHVSCMLEFTKAASVAVADTLPVTSAVVDDFVDGGQRQKNDDVLKSTAEFLGGGLTFALELGAWVGAIYATEGKLFIPPFIGTLGVSNVPYRSTRLQWQKAKLNCDAS